MSPGKNGLRRRVNLIQEVMGRIQGKILADGHVAGSKLPSDA